LHLEVEGKDKAILPEAEAWVKNISICCMRKSKMFEPKPQVAEKLLSDYSKMK